MTISCNCRDEDDVRSFREMLKDKNFEVPRKQSTLAVPTESEVRVAMQAVRAEDTVLDA